jgi:hypothetical protein
LLHGADAVASARREGLIWKMELPGRASPAFVQSTLRRMYTGFIAEVAV